MRSNCAAVRTSTSRSPAVLQKCAPQIYVDLARLTSASPVCVCTHSLKAKQLYRALHAAVDAFISDASCFLVLLAAHDAGCAALASRAANHALNRFSQASVWDVEGLQALPLPVLEQFVQV